MFSTTIDWPSARPRRSAIVRATRSTAAGLHRAMILMVLLDRPLRDEPREQGRAEGDDARDEPAAFGRRQWCCSSGIVALAQVSRVCW
jgi:hypothetical protein